MDETLITELENQINNLIKALHQLQLENTSLQKKNTALKQENVALIKSKKQAASSLNILIKNLQDQLPCKTQKQQ